MTNLTLTWGLKYLSLGYSIIPIKPKSKEPLIPWTEFQTRRASETELKIWLQKWPDMNLGVVTGQISAIAVVDLDGIQGIRFGSSHGITSSIVQRTGNGRQVFYKWQPGIKNSVKLIAPGVDIRSDGGYVVVCPSIHPSGRMYRWERFVPALIPSFPTELTTVTNVTPPTVGKSDGWIAKALEEMKIGNIDDTLTSILGRMRRDGWSTDDARSLLYPHAIKAGAEEGHLEEKIRNIWGRYPSQDEMRLHKSNEQSLLLSSRYGECNASGLYIKSPTNDNDFEQFNLSLQSIKESGDRLLTGFPSLDKFFEGGLKSERLFTVAARTGTGKTNFAIALASNICQQGKKVLFFSTEFQYNKIWSRYIATLTRDSDFRRHSFYVCDSFSPNISQVEEAIKEVEPDVFIFDHINHISEERESLGSFMQGANFLQRKYNAQGVMVAQLSRQADWVENGKRIEPRMSMIKGSGTIEQASSRVLLLSETRQTPEYNEILGVLDKNDSGDRGIINFALYKNPYIFKELV